MVHRVNFWDTYPLVWNPKYLDKSVALFLHHRNTKEEKSPTNRVTSQISRINGSIVLLHPVDMAQKEEEVFPTPAYAWVWPHPSTLTRGAGMLSAQEHTLAIGLRAVLEPTMVSLSSSVGD